MRRVDLGGADWAAAVASADPSAWLVLHASWAAVEPERGQYAEPVLEAGRKALIAARRRGVDVLLVTHAGGLPDWQIARDGWLDSDALAGFGCYVDRLAHTWGELVKHWVGLWCPLAEASLYERDRARAARVLLDAQASAWLHLRKAPGPGGGGTLVGVAERFDVPRRRRDQLVAGLLGQGSEAHQLVQILSTGQLAAPFSAVGELPNGTAASDFTVALAPNREDLHRIWRTGRGVFVLDAPGVAEIAEEEGVRVLGAGAA